jgi:hypothetical protein
MRPFSGDSLVGVSSLKPKAQPWRATPRTPSQIFAIKVCFREIATAFSIKLKQPGFGITNISLAACCVQGLMV